MQDSNALPRRRRAWCLAAALCLGGAAVQAGYDEGVAAHQRGDMAAALREWRPAAAAGDRPAQRGMGWLHEFGQGVPQDLPAAMAWYQKAAAQGDAFSQYRIGLMHEHGRGVPRDMARALEWYRKSADAGWAEAQSQLGWAYLSGTGVPRDVAQGAAWTRKAAAQGDTIGELNLGWIYRDGLGAPADPAQARQWYRKAADKGNPVAQRNLAWLLDNGLGGPRDAAQALAWYRKAAAQGDAEAQQALAPKPAAPPAAAAPTAQPSGSLALLCQLQTGQGYVFVIDERAQQVAARDSDGQDWVIFRDGQPARHRVGDQWVAMVDHVRVDAAAIRVLREPRDEPVPQTPNVSNNRQTNELAGLLGNLVGVLATSSSVVIDRNSGVIRTGGMGLFPKQGAGECEPYRGRRF